MNRGKKGKQLTAAGMAALLAITGSGIPVQAGESSASDGTISSPILITEVIPNTKNMNGADAYEYYELTNISSSAVNLSDYDIVYVNGSTRTRWTPNACEIPENSSILVWIRNSGNADATITDFCNYYDIEETAPVLELSCDGLSNSGPRTLEVTTKTGNTLTKAAYTKADSANGKIDEDEAIIFTYEGNTGNAVYDQNPTPLTINQNDISGTYTAPEKLDKTDISVTKISTLAQDTNLKIAVTATNLGLDHIVSGKIIIDGTEEYPLTYDENGTLTGTVPFAALAEKGLFSYVVSIFDGTNTAKTPEQQVTIEGSETASVDRTKAPVLTITELLPDSSNVNGGDAYEFIEIYNNSDRTINLKDYRLYYTYPDTGVQTVWWETNADKNLAPGQTLVFWVKNGSNESLTLSDFNTKFGTELTSDQLIEISCGGMANSGRRGLRICTNTGDVIDEIIYNDNGADNTNADKSITYQNQYINDVFTTVMTSDTAQTTPGTTAADEKPVYQATVTEPQNQPKLTDHTVTSFSNATEALTFSLEATSEESTVKTVKLYLKYNDQDQFDSFNLTRSGENGNNFEKSLSNVDLLNKRSFTYYFEVSDGFSVVTTEAKTISNTDSTDQAALNLKDGDTITSQQLLIAHGNQLLIDGTEVAEADKSINGCGKIAFEATDTDVFFKNAVAVGNDVIGIFNEGTYNSVATYIYDISAEKFDADTRTITVEFHAGNKANVLEHNIENNDDFTLRNIRLVLPNGKTLTPSKYQAKKGLGEVEHDNLNDAPLIDVNIASQETNISMGDGTSKYEILYATFQLEESDFDAIRYLWDTTQSADGKHTISNGSEKITVNVDNTAPVITTNMEDGKEYHNGTIEASAVDAISEDITTVVLLDGKAITVPYEFRALEMLAGEHTLQITSRDEVGNTAEKTVIFATPKESADIDENVSPENGTTVTSNPILSVQPTDVSGDSMTVTFKKGERYTLADSNITMDSGISAESGSVEKVFEENSGNGFPYNSFQIVPDETVDENTVISIKWTGKSNNAKTFMYAYNTASGTWEKLDAVQTTDGESMTLTGEVVLKDHLLEGSIRVIVQNGEGYAPTQYAPATEPSTEPVSEAASENTDISNAVAALNESDTVQTNAINNTPGDTPTYNQNDTPRESYDFTFAVESDTQYYNEDYEGNTDQVVDGVYQHQLNIHNWLLANRERMNIQYLFHDGDIIDDEPNEQEWGQADAAYKLLDQKAFPYGVLAGNHDVGHLNGTYENFSKYFGETRYASNPWYGGSYKDNRGHYDLISVGGIDFIMVYMGWGIGDEEIEWMNDVLAQYPERRAILNFHEYLLASGGLGEEPQRIHDEVVAKNENVCMVLSGHYHNAKTTIDTFTNEDGSERKVYNMLFDYQGLIEGGAGYLRLMHFDLEGEKIIIRTYTPSHGGTEYSNYGDYDAKPSENPNTGNEFCIENANLNDAESFEIPFADLGITCNAKTLETEALDVNVYNNTAIGTVTGVASGATASFEWTDAADGINGWYAEVTDDNGGLSRTNVYYVNVNRDTEAPVLTVPGDLTLKVGDEFDEMSGVSAIDQVDGDLTDRILVTGKVNTSIADTYTLHYEVTDAAGNKAQKDRTIVVTESGEGIQTPEENNTETPGNETTVEKDNTIGSGDNASANTTSADNSVQNTAGKSNSSAVTDSTGNADRITSPKTDDPANGLLSRICMLFSGSALAAAASWILKRKNLPEK